MARLWQGAARTEKGDPVPAAVTSEFAKCTHVSYLYWKIVLFVDIVM